jgi:hypothetical protein
METESPGLFEQWTSSWSDLVSFEIIALEDRSGSPGAGQVREPAN